jgi:hypothetical protein
VVEEADPVVREVVAEVVVVEEAVEAEEETSSAITQLLRSEVGRQSCPPEKSRMSRRAGRGQSLASATSARVSLGPAAYVAQLRYRCYGLNSVSRRYVILVPRRRC